MRPMKKVLFIDRDGTILLEPKTDYQVDSLEDFSFLPGAISALSKIAARTDFELVMVTNQDGLGTSSFPEDTFWPYQNLMIEILESSGVKFSEVLIDKTKEEEGADTRKPGTGMLGAYLSGDYDLAGSFVLGDRLTDIELAKNLGARGILISEELQSDEAALKTTDWEEIYRFLLSQNRKTRVSRKTKETDINIQLSLDGTGQAKIDTGLNFFNHMLEQIAKHSGCDLAISVKGDLEVDEHHTIEDTAIALGEAFAEALGDKRGVERYGFVLPMDDAEAAVSLDFGGRSWLVWEAEFKREMVGDVPTEMFYHFFKSFSDAAKANINIKVSGDNEHHKIEAIFKGLAKSIKQAVRLDANSDSIPSTKGTL